MRKTSSCPSIKRWGALNRVGLGPIKITDGVARVQSVVVATVLRQLVLLNDARQEALKKLERGLIFNCRGLRTGCIQALFELERG